MKYHILGINILSHYTKAYFVTAIIIIVFLALNVTFFRQVFLCKKVSFVCLLSDFTIETKLYSTITPGLTAL